MPLGALELGTVFILVVVIALPLGGLAFALGAGNALKEIGKGQFAIDQDMSQSSGGSAYAVTAEVREEEIRQMIQARSDRGVAKGKKALNVDKEVEKLLASESDTPNLGSDRGLREEVRQLVVARNERRQRQGKKALDVDKEVERQLRELENLGQ